MNVDILPPKKVVAQITFHGASKGDFWLALERPEPSICIHDPGFDVYLFVNADTIAIHKVWAGMASFADYLDDGRIELSGLSAHVDAIESWSKLRDFACMNPAVITR